MADQATVDLEGVEPAAAPAAAGPDGTPTGQQQGDPDALGEPGRRALQAERDARADAERQLRDAQTQLTSQAARITELETGSGSLTEQNGMLQQQVTRLQVAVDRGLDASLVGRLVGSTAEELAADADALLALMGARQPTAPRADPSQGSRTPAPQTPEAAFKAAFAQLLNP